MHLEKVKEVQIEFLESLIEPKIYQTLNKDTYTVYKVNPNALLTHRRFCLTFKILFLKYKEICPSFAEQIYSDHIRAFSFGSYTEPGNPKKNSKQKFIDTFVEINNIISTSGFDPEKSMLPISKNLQIENGSHRLAAAIYNRKNVYCIVTNNTEPNFSFSFFINEM